jgi:hypothetical protein
VIAAASDNTVAIVALGVSVIVGLGSPVIVSIFARKRLDRELDARDDAQRRAIRHEAEREVLDSAALLLQRYRFLAGQDPPSPTWVKEIADLTYQAGGQYARLEMWFGADAEVAKAYGLMLGYCAQLNLPDVNRKHLEDLILGVRKDYLSAARERLEAL